MRNAFNDKSESQRDNFISLYKDQLFLFSKQDIKLNQTYELYDKNTGETIEGFEFSSQKKLNEKFINYLEEDIVKEEENLQAITNKMKKLERENEKNENEQISLNEQLNNLNNQCDKQVKELNTYQSQIDDLEEKSKDKDYKKMKNEINEEISKIKLLKDKVKKSINETKKEIKTFDINLTNKKQEINFNIKEIQKLENQSNMVNNNISYYNELISDLDNNYKYIYSFNARYEKDLDVANILDSSSKRQRNLYFESKDKGTIAKINRYYNALLNLRKGYYKNPYFFEAIKNPENIIINERKSINDEICNKYRLNDKQFSAVNKAINTNSICFIQGPPGTGKTQTICSIAE